MFDNKFHQIAMYVQEPDVAVTALRQIGYQDWVHDEATLVGHVMGYPIETRGSMWFNYEFFNGELEFLHYEGPSWHSLAGRTDDAGNCLGLEPNFISHKSVYTENLERDSKQLAMTGFGIVQEFETHDHINKYLLGKKQRFKEAIFGTRHLFGFDLKLIQRVFD